MPGFEGMNFPDLTTDAVQGPADGVPSWPITARLELVHGERAYRGGDDAPGTDHRGPLTAKD